MTEQTSRALDGITVLVTGGAHGLGLAMTEALSAAGAAVFVPDISEENLEHLSARDVGDVTPIHADVADERDVERAVGVCLEKTGRVDVLINNAGISPTAIRPDAATNPILFWELSPGDFRRFLGVHTIGPHLLARAVVPGMIERGWGRVVNVTTSHITMLGRGRAAYGPPKAASEALVAVMANDLAGSGVTANVLIPGGAAATHPETERPDAALLIPPEVMGPPAVFLSSRASDGITARRFQACFWDPEQSDAANVARAAAPVAWPAFPTNRRS